MAEKSTRQYSIILSATSTSGALTPLTSAQSSETPLMPKYEYNDQLREIEIGFVSRWNRTVLDGSIIHRFLYMVHAPSILCDPLL